MGILEKSRKPKAPLLETYLRRSEIKTNPQSEDYTSAEQCKHLLLNKTYDVETKTLDLIFSEEK